MKKLLCLLIILPIVANAVVYGGTHMQREYYLDALQTACEYMKKNKVNKATVFTLSETYDFVIEDCKKLEELEK